MSARPDSDTRFGRAHTWTRLHARWQQCTRRERTLLVLLAALAVASVLWMALLRPALHAVDDARTRLPQLHRDMAQLAAVVREAQSLQQGSAARVPDAQLAGALLDSARRAGLDTAVQVKETDEARWVLTVDGAPAGRLLAWLADLPFLLHVRTHAVTLERAVVEGRERPGFVSGHLVFTREAAP